MIDPITEYILIKEFSDTSNPSFEQMVNGLSRHFLGVSAGKAFKGAAAITAMIAISYKFYKDFLSKAAKACKGKKGEEKKDCMKKYKIEGKKKRLSLLMKAKTKCSQDECKSKLQKQIDKVKSQLR